MSTVGRDTPHPHPSMPSHSLPSARVCSVMRRVTPAATCSYSMPCGLPARSFPFHIHMSPAREAARVDRGALITAVGAPRSPSTNASRAAITPKLVLVHHKSSCLSFRRSYKPSSSSSNTHPVQPLPPNGATDGLHRNPPPHHPPRSADDQTPPHLRHRPRQTPRRPPPRRHRIPRLRVQPAQPDPLLPRPQESRALRAQRAPLRRRHGRRRPRRRRLQQGRRRPDRRDRLLRQGRVQAVYPRGAARAARRRPRGRGAHESRVVRAERAAAAGVRRAAAALL